MKVIFFVFMLFVSSVAQSAFYKCVVDGNTTFTDQPCDQGAKSEVLNNIEVVKRVPSTRRQTENASSVERMNKATASMYADRRKSELKRDISDKEKSVVTLQKRMDAEVAGLRFKKRFASNNLAGATYEGSISEEISAVVSRYDSKISVAQRDIDRFYKELERL